jgi:nucleotide-binding universal stress UspA family protein
MIDLPYAEQPFVTVAVNFDRHTKSLVALAASLAKSVSKKLCLVHVMTPPIDFAATASLGMPEGVMELLPRVTEALRADADGKLKALAAEQAAGVATELVVAEGPVIEALIREASRVGTFLMITGAGHNAASRLLPSGFSTGLSLLAAAPMPVMVIDTETHLPKLDGAWRMLVADDFSPQSDAALRMAAALAERVKQPSISHIHISSLTAGNLKAALEGAAAAAHTEMTPPELNDIFRAVHDKQRERLEDRFAEYRDLVEARGGEYSAEVFAGSLRSELERAVWGFDPDVLIFGKHRAFHAKPFSLGRLPVRAMLDFRRPVIAVPAL